MNYKIYSIHISYWQHKPDLSIIFHSTWHMSPQTDIQEEPLVTDYLTTTDLIHYTN